VRPVKLLNAIESRYLSGQIWEEDSWMPLRFVFEILAAAAALPSAPLQDCRTIENPQARLACYDARDRGPGAPPAAQPPAAPAVGAVQPAPAASPPARTEVARAPAPSVRTESMSSADIVRADPTGRITAVTPLRYGLFRIELDDGRLFDTTSNTIAPPSVGEAVSLRRTLIGTTFLDIRGRSPITVRLQRQYR